MSDLADRIRRRLANEAEGNVYLDISWVMSVIAEEDSAPQPDTASRELREAAQAVVVLTDDLARWDELNRYVINSERDYLAGNLDAAWDRLRAALASEDRPDA
mgnify:FL=1